jgi:dihydroneopterin aldolase
VLKIKTQKLEINEIEIFASIGVFEFEKKAKNRFLVSIAVEGNYSKSMASDHLEDTLDYQTIYDIVQAEMAIPADLIEHVCSRIASRISKIDFSIDRLIVKIVKCSPPLKGNVANTSFELIVEG